MNLVLESWGDEYISDALKKSILEAEKIEPREDVKERIKKLVLL